MTGLMFNGIINRVPTVMFSPARSKRAGARFRRANVVVLAGEMGLTNAANELKSPICSASVVADCMVAACLTTRH